MQPPDMFGRVKQAQVGFVDLLERSNERHGVLWLVALAFSAKSDLEHVGVRLDILRIDDMMVEEYLLSFDLCHCFRGLFDVLFLFLDVVHYEIN